MLLIVVYYFGVTVILSSVLSFADDCVLFTSGLFDLARYGQYQVHRGVLGTPQLVKNTAKMFLLLFGFLFFSPQISKFTLLA